MKIKNLLLALLANLIVITIHAQEIEKSIKLKLEGLEEDYKIFNLNDNGILVANYPKIHNAGYELRYTRYNQNLEEQKSFKLQLGNKESVGFTKYFGDNFFYFFVGRDLNLTGSSGFNPAFKKFTLYQLDLDRMEIKSMNFSSKTAVHIRDMEFRNEKLFIHGILKESVIDIENRLKISLVTCFIPWIFHQKFSYPFVYEANFKNNNKKEYYLSNFKYSLSDYLSLEFQDSSDNMNLILSSIKGSKNRFFMQKIKNQTIQNEVEIKFPSKMKAKDGKIFNYGESTDFIAGVYDFKSNNSKNGYSGIYVSKTENGNMNYLTTLKFDDFKNFNIHQDAPIEKEFLNTKIKNIIVKDGKTYVMGELFYPKIKFEVSKYKSIEGFNIIREAYNMEGWTWIGGFIICLDNEGKFLWENGLNLKEEHLVSNNDSRINFVEKENGVIEIQYDHSFKILTKSIDKDGKGSNIDYTNISDEQIEEKNDNRKPQEQLPNEMEWFDDYKLSYEFKNEQNGKNKGNKFDLFLKINKIKFDYE